MVRKLLCGLASVAALAVPLATASAQPSSNIPGLHVSFLDPTGTISNTSPVDVFMHLALDANASPFVFDGNSPGTNFGLGGITMPTQGNYFLNGVQYNGIFDGSATQYQSASTTVSLECSGTFFGACNGTGAYNFNFYYCGTGPNCFLGQTGFTLQPGDSYDFLLGTLSPVGGAAPPGTYTLFNASAVISVNGTGFEADSNGNLILDANGNPIPIPTTDANGNPVSFSGDVNLASACENGGSNPQCIFTRNVVGTTATPEPATLGLLGLGLVVIGAARRRRRTS